MTIKPARKLEIAQRRQKVADLQLQSWTQDAIAQELGVSQGLVAADLKKIRQAWRESAIRDFDAARGLELAKLDRIEREASAAWLRSQQPQQSATVNGEAGSQTAKRTVKHQNGDPRFLDIILRCGEARRQLLGLDAPSKIAPTTPDGQPLTREQRQIHIQAILSEHFGTTVVVPEETTEADDEGQAVAVASGLADGRGTGPTEPTVESSRPRAQAASPAS